MYIVITTLLILPGGLGQAFLNLHHSCSPGTRNMDTLRQELPVMTTQCVTSCKDANKMKPYPLSRTHFTPIKLANQFILIIGPIPF